MNPTQHLEEQADKEQEQERLTLLLDLALSLTMNDPHRSLVLADEAYMLATYAHNEAALAKASRIAGSACTTLGQYEQALEHLDKALEIYRNTDREGFARTLNLIGLVHNDREDYLLAMEFYSMAGAIFQKLKDKLGLGSTLHNRGNVCAATGRYTEALSSYKEAMVLFQEIGHIGYQTNALTGIADVHRKLGDYSIALEYFNRALIMKEEIGDKYGIAVGLNNIGLVYESISSYSEALQSFAMSLKLFEEIGDRNYMANVLLGIGNVHSSLGHHTMALEYYGKCLHLKEELGSRQGIASALGNIGAVYMDHGDHASALEYYTRAYTIFRQVEDRANTAVLISQIGSVYGKTGQLQKALECYQESVEISEQLGEIDNRSGFQLGLAETYIRLQDFSSALQYAEEALSVKKTIGNRTGAVRCLMIIANSMVGLGRPEEALQHLEHALELVEELMLQPLRAEVLEQCALLHKEAGDFRQALDYQEKFHAARQDILQQEAGRKLKNVQLLRDFEKTQKEAEINRLKSEKIQQEMELQSRHLTAVTMSLVQRNEFLQNLRNELQHIADRAGKKAQPFLKDTTRRIKKHAQAHEGWTVFEQQFSKLHRDFIQTLSKNYPLLSPTELKVCALIKLGLSTKEIAHLLCVSVRCIETHRYGVRKKMNLPPDTNLIVLLSGY